MNLEEPLIFLIKLAWACRYRLPLLITVGFMALDIRMQLEIHVQTRRIPARRRNQNVASTSRDELYSDDSSSSWLTVSEDEEDTDVNSVSTSYEEGVSTSLRDEINVNNVENVSGQPETSYLNKVSSNPVED